MPNIETRHKSGVADIDCRVELAEFEQLVFDTTSTSQLRQYSLKRDGQIDRGKDGY